MKTGNDVHFSLPVSENVNFSCRNLFKMKNILLYIKKNHEGIISKTIYQIFCLTNISLFVKGITKLFNQSKNFNFFLFLAFILKYFYQVE